MHSVPERMVISKTISQNGGASIMTFWNQLAKFFGVGR